jgi:hypothetical protein
VWVRSWLCKLQKGCTRLAAANDKVYQSLAHGWWFSPGTPASSIIKTGRHDIAEIFLKMALNTNKNTKRIQSSIKKKKKKKKWLVPYIIKFDIFVVIFFYKCQ